MTKIEGYAARFNEDYPVYGGPENGGWMEVVAPGAFDRSLKSDKNVRFVLPTLPNGDGPALAWTADGTLRLSVDDVGLKAEIDIPDRLADIFRTSDEEMTIHTFRVASKSWSKDETHRRIDDLEVIDIGLKPAEYD